MGFAEIVSILVLPAEVLGIFQKKNTPHDWVLLPTVRISAETDEICGRVNVPNNYAKIFSSLVLLGTRPFYIRSKIFLYFDNP